MLDNTAIGIKQHLGPGILARPPHMPSILHLLAATNRIEFLGILIQRGAVVDDGVGSRGTPLHFAAIFGKAEAVLFLLDLGAQTDALDANGMTLFMKACEADQEVTAQILIN